MRQVTAPPTELPARPGGQQQRWRTSLHAQGALAVEGEAYIWKGGAGKEGKEGAAKEAGGKEAGGNGASQPAGEPQAAGSPGAATKQPPKGSGGEDGGGGSEEPRRTRLASALEKAAAADEDAAEQHRRGNGAAVVAGGGASAVQGPTGSQPGEACEEATAAAAQAAAQADAGTAPTAAAPAAAAAAATEPEAGRQPGASLEQFMRPLEQLGERVSDMLHNVTHPGEAQQQPSGGGAAAAAAAAGNSEPSAAAASQQQQGTVDGKPGGSISGGSSSSGGSPSSGPLLGLSSQSITATIQDSVALLQQVHAGSAKTSGRVPLLLHMLRALCSTALCCLLDPRRVPFPPPQASNIFRLPPPLFNMLFPRDFRFSIFEFDIQTFAFLLLTGEGERGAADHQRAGRLAAAAQPAACGHPQHAAAPPPLQHAACAGRERAGVGWG